MNDRHDLIGQAYRPDKAGKHNAEEHHVGMELFDRIVAAFQNLVEKTPGLSWLRKKSWDSRMYERRSRLHNRQHTEFIFFCGRCLGKGCRSDDRSEPYNTATSCFMRLRRLTASHLPSYRLSDEIEADESCFGGARKGKRERRAVGKKPFVLLKKNGRVCTVIIPDARTEKHFSPSSGNGWNLTV